MAKHRANESVRWAFLANLAVALVKGVVAWFSGSSVLLAETLHSTADCGNQLLLWFGHYRARRPPSVQHPLGHGKEIYFWSFIVAVLLFFGGGVLSFIEGAMRLRSHEQITSAGWGIATILFALAAEGASLRMAMRQLHGIHSLAALYRWFRETRRSDLLMVVSEDLAAVVGLLIALAALLASMATQQVIFDAIGSMLVGLLLVLVAGNLIVEVKALLIGESAAKTQREAIFKILSGCAGVARVETLITLQYGGEIFVAARLAMRSDDGRQIERTINGCRTALRQSFQNLSQIFLEPKLPSRS